MSTPANKKKIIVLLALVLCLLSSFLVTGGIFFFNEDDDGPVPYGGEDEVRGGNGYSVLASAGCHNDYVHAAHECRGVIGSDIVGQQSNGCLHCLKSGGGTATDASYPKFFDAISTIKDGYSSVGDGACTEAIEEPLGRWQRNTLCIAAGQQDNGCWHLLGEGDTPYGTYYKRYIR